MQTDNDKKAISRKTSGKRFAVIFAVLILGGGIYGTIKYLHSLKHEETEDAQIESRISPVISRVSGYISEIRVQDNQQVKKGDTLLILDDRDFKLRVLQAEAAMEAAKSNVSVADAGISVADANVISAQSSVSTIDARIEAARINLWRAEQDFKRYDNLIKDHSITQQQYEQALAAKQTAEKQLEILQAEKNNASSQTGVVRSQKEVTAGQASAAKTAVAQREAELEMARLNLSYTVITAAIDGQVSRINLQPGQMVQAGQALFNIVEHDNIWVVANFKETQLAKMKVGQKVTITVDAFPKHEFEGHIVSFSPATGSKFSVLPADNASGNFIKVVQRLPVKIEFSQPEDTNLRLLKAGMNVMADVHLQ